MQRLSFRQDALFGSTLRHIDSVAAPLSCAIMMIWGWPAEDKLAYFLDSRFMLCAVLQRNHHQFAGTMLIWPAAAPSECAYIVCSRLSNTEQQR